MEDNDICAHSTSQNPNGLAYLQVFYGFFMFKLIPQPILGVDWEKHRYTHYL